MCLDGPTFVTRKGGTGFRRSGSRHGYLAAGDGAGDRRSEIGDAQVDETALPETSSADVEITVPLENETARLLVGTSKLRLTAYR